MEDRLLKLLDVEQLSSSKFADIIGVQRSSVSHILSGRNKPSFDFLQKTLKAFPLLNADWLVLGEGKMYEGDLAPLGGTLFDQPLKAADQVQNNAPEEAVKDDMESTVEEDKADEDAVSSEKSQAEKPIAALHSMPGPVSSAVKAVQDRKIARVILLYNDNSFESFEQG